MVAGKMSDDTENMYSNVEVVSSLCYMLSSHCTNGQILKQSLQEEHIETCQNGY